MNRHRHHWTEHEDAMLRIHWGTKPVANVASIIGRTPIATYLRAGKLGIGAGCPQGFEYLYTAAERHGVDTKTMRRILRWAHVHIWPASVHPGPKSTGRRHVVEPSDVDEAVSRWREHETPKQAADRTGYDQHTMRRILRTAIASGEIPDTDPASGKHWLIHRDVVDALVAKRLRGESAAQAAERVGISYPTLHRWLRDAGIHHGRGVYLDPDVVDRVVTDRKATCQRHLRSAWNNSRRMTEAA
jgi:predicted DNA-binding protein (UPF0251 family)